MPAHRPARRRGRTVEQCRRGRRPLVHVDAWDRRQARAPPRHGSETDGRTPWTGQQPCGPATSARDAMIRRSAQERGQRASSSSGATVRRSRTSASSAIRATTGGSPARSAAGQLVRPPPRVRAAAAARSGISTVGAAPPPTAEDPSATSTASGPRPRARHRAGPPRAAAPRPRARPASAGRARSRRAAGLVLGQHGVERGQRHLVHAQRAVERVRAHGAERAACGPPPGRPAARPAACRR